MNPFKKYKSVISYIFFGGITTVINVIAYHILYSILKLGNIPSVIIAWVLSVSFAFVTNKLFVFKSKTKEKNKVFKEILSFTLCRVATGALEVVLMYLLVDKIGFNGTIMKLITNIIVIILNYIFSKMFIFKKRPL